MRPALLLFGFALPCAACGHQAAPVARPPRPAAAAPLRAITSVQPTGCRAQPSTVYGAEPVVFDIDARAPGGDAALHLVDQNGAPVTESSARVPGTWRAPELGSGDFTLLLASGAVSCSVTVNRELSRASETSP